EPGGAGASQPSGEHEAGPRGVGGADQPARRAKPHDLVKNCQQDNLDHQPDRRTGLNFGHRASVCSDRQPLPGEHGRGGCSVRWGMSVTKNSVTNQVRAWWIRTPGHGEIRTETLPEPGPDEVLVRTRYSGVSRGTETLVFSGLVPEDQYAVMRAPFQEGDFPGPVKYGYLNVGQVEAGPPHLLGRTVFCLYPHQTRYVVPAHAVVPVPDQVPAARAVLAGTVETAVNALWDAAPLIGDRATVVGAGMVGCCVAALLARFPGVRVELVDVDPRRAAVAEALGVAFALPAEASAERDLVVHASATAAGL